MPGYVMHVTFAKLVGEKLGIAINNRFLAASLIPDACTCEQDFHKKVSHFAQRLDGLFKNPDLDYFLRKYKNLLNDELVLGIYTHLYLDKYFYTELLYKIYNISDGNMINKITGKKYNIWQDFFVKDGIYKEYSAINKMLIKDFNLDLYSLDFKLSDLPEMPEYNFGRLKTFKNRVDGFLNEDGYYTGEYIEYEELKFFIENLSVRFVQEFNKILV